MKHIIKKILPKALVEQIVLKRKRSDFKKKGIQEVFTQIKETGYWNSKESLSGNGSELNVTQAVISGLEHVLSKFKIKSMLDIPCGDFNWMQHVNLNDIDYLGCDIVPSIIMQNKKVFESNELRFSELDLTKDNLPQVDLIFCRDCLVHLAYKDIYRALVNIKKSNSNYLMATSFIKTPANKDIITGDWRRLNFEQAPFYFPQPLYIIDEKYIKKNRQYIDKSLCLWKIDDIKLPFRLKLYYWLT
ncbi:MAG TPA: class I SAM-dependent methyltransferase [Flavobacteriaceae bacterium]